MKRYCRLFSLTIILATILAACSVNGTTAPQTLLPPSPTSASSGNPTLTATPEITFPSTASSTAGILDVSDLEYYWPLSLPQGLEIEPCALRANDTGFSFAAGTGGVGLTIAGGSEVHWVPYLPPCNDEYQGITVRGQQGCATVDNSGRYVRPRVFWQKGETIYAALGSGLQLEEVLETVEHLEVIERDVFHQRIEPLVTPTATPSGPLVYYWPSGFPKGLVVDAIESSADESGFVLGLISPGNEWSAVIKGGSKADLNEFCNDLYEPGVVHGQQGFISTGTGAGFGVAWRENGHPYVIGGSGMSLAEVQELADTLESVDLIEWRQRLEQSQ
jgi:hypothetical protein